MGEDNKNDTALNLDICTQIDLYDFVFGSKDGPYWLQKLNSLISWEGGIAFFIVSWLLICPLYLFLVRIFLKIRNHFFPEKNYGVSEELPASGKRHTFNLFDWLFLDLDENSFGRNETTYLKWLADVIKILAVAMILSIALTIMNFHGNKLDEMPKTLRSTGLNNIGVNGTHSVVIFALLLLIVFKIKVNGHEPRTQPPTDFQLRYGRNFTNRRCLLMFTRINPATYSRENFIHYLTEELQLEGIIIESLSEVNRLDKIDSTEKRLKFTENVLELSRKTFDDKVDATLFTNFMIHTRRWWSPVRWWNMLTRKPVTVNVFTHFENERTKLLSYLESLQANPEFAGAAFVLFDNEDNAQIAKRTLNSTGDFCCFKKFVVQDAPQDSDINWSELKYHQKFQFYRTIKRIIFCQPIVYFVSICCVVAPGIIARKLQLDEIGLDSTSIFFKRYMLPTIVTYVTPIITSLVTRFCERRKGYVTQSEFYAGVLQSGCYLEMTMYILRVIAIKPLPLLLHKHILQDLQLKCLFFPAHGTGVTVAIVTNTALNILNTHGYLDYLWKYPYYKFFKFASQVEFEVWKQTRVGDFDFPSRYAEVVNNFVLTILFLPVFPVIGVVTPLCFVARYISDRIALTSGSFPISNVECSLLHKKAVDIILICLSGAPLALIAYRSLQMKAGMNFIYAGILTPLILLVIYWIVLLYTYFYDAIAKWFHRRLLKRRRQLEIA